jgi:hypothetical protein
MILNDTHERRASDTGLWVPDKGNRMGTADARPRARECQRKLRVATRRVAEGHWTPLDPMKLTSNLDDVGLFGREATRRALVGAFEEIAPADYAGKRPPEKSYEVRGKGLELFAFSWQSSAFGRRMYLKFAIDRNEEVWLASIHTDRPPSKRGQP